MVDAFIGGGIPLSGDLRHVYTCFRQSPEMQEASENRLAITWSGGLKWKRNGPVAIPEVEKHMDYSLEKHWKKWLEASHLDFMACNVARVEPDVEKVPDGSVVFFPSPCPISSALYVVGEVPDEEERKKKKAEKKKRKDMEPFNVAIGAVPQFYWDLDSRGSRAAAAFTEMTLFKQSQYDISETYRRALLIKAKAPPVNSEEGYLSSMAMTSVPLLDKNSVDGRSAQKYLERREAINRETRILQERSQRQLNIKQMQDLAERRKGRGGLAPAYLPMILQGEDYEKYTHLPPPPYHSKFIEIIEAKRDDIYRSFGVSPLLSKNSSKNQSVSSFEEIILDPTNYHEKLNIVLKDISRRIFAPIVKKYNQVAETPYESTDPYYQIYLAPPKKIMRDEAKDTEEKTEAEQAQSKETSKEKEKKDEEKLVKQISTNIIKLTEKRMHSSEEGSSSGDKKRSRKDKGRQ